MKENPLPEIGAGAAAAAAPNVNPPAGTLPAPKGTPKAPKELGAAVSLSDGSRSGAPNEKPRVPVAVAVAVAVVVAVAAAAAAPLLMRNGPPLLPREGVEGAEGAEDDDAVGGAKYTSETEPSQSILIRCILRHVGQGSSLVTCWSVRALDKSRSDTFPLHV